MLLLADENIPGPVVRFLRDRGHDVLWILESHMSSNDAIVLQLGRQQKRLIITLDKGFRARALRQTEGNGISLLLVRCEPPHLELKPDRVAALIESVSDWTGRFGFINHKGQLRTRGT